MRYYIICILIILIMFVGCTKNPTLVLEEKGIQKLTSQERLELFCNGDYEVIYSWGKANVKVDNCNYFLKYTLNGNEYEGTIIDSPPNQKCTLHTKLNGTLIEPPRKDCVKNHVTYKTGDNEWKTFFNDKNNTTILIKNKN